MLAILSEHPEYVNSTRLGGNSLYAPLHHAALGGAAVETVQRLLEFGAWRTTRNARGERPVDIAESMSHKYLASLLQPEFKRQVPIGILLKIQGHFHAVIVGRARELIQKHALRLPELEPLLELETPEVFFSVPGMYGGFRFWLAEEGIKAKLITESFCRVVGGSGQRHKIDSSGSRLLAEGFV